MQSITEFARHVEVVVQSGLLREAVRMSHEHLLLAREEERRRLRRDLHDGLGPTLAAMKLRLAALRRDVGQAPPAADALHELRTMISQATDEVRRVVENLRPPMLDDCGLVDAWRNLPFVPPGLHLHVDAPQPLPAIPAGVEVALYRIAAEAVHNTVRHANATRCYITLSVDCGSATLKVADNGSGIPSPFMVGVGTRAIVERARELGGDASFEALSEGGTCVTATMPLHHGGEP